MHNLHNGLVCHYSINVPRVKKNFLMSNFVSTSTPCANQTLKKSGHLVVQTDLCVKIALCTASHCEKIEESAGHHENCCNHVIYIYSHILPSLTNPKSLSWTVLHYFVSL